jgi:sugar O-acyltransferase (sialic acid O-acetyltransferase NeuD family)
MALVIVAGASGQHAIVVYEAAVLAGHQIAGFATVGDATPAAVLDCPWLGVVGDIASSEIRRGSQFIVACGSNTLRFHESESLLAQGASLQSVCHPAAIVSPSARIGPGSAVLAGAIIGPRATLGRGVIINHAASVDHDCWIGDYSNVSPGARFGGCVTTGPRTFVGLNASVLQGLRIGSDATVGAGAVVTQRVEEGTTVVGIPAYPIVKSQRHQA